MKTGKKKSDKTLEKNDYLITQTLPALVKMLDRNLEKRAKDDDNADAEAKRFAEKRLSQVLDLSRLQYNTHSLPEVMKYSSTAAITCGVKQRMDKYLQGRDQRNDPKDENSYTKSLYKDKVLRAQLSFTEKPEAEQRRTTEQTITQEMQKTILKQLTRTGSHEPLS